ncbi:DNA-processing protein DprA [Ferrimonas marina]|uniref:DNA processing protein n=1 Tax=Ferrimonas marina TaxID=299255 RepID=A0A1M5ZHC5_9GAMM|nr:DNA-processing protein DprA [Ferrimonas marina]SHI23598.1 DNA processing protein [Ferrimonas marina]
MIPANELHATLCLASLRGLGLTRKLALLEQHSAVAAWQQLQQGQFDNLSLPVSALSDAMAQAEQALQWQSAAPARHLLSLTDPRYPQALAQIADPPLMLFVQGQVEALSAPALAMVGSRNASRPGLELAQSWAHSLASIGWVMVSGLAVGIDGACHKGALNGGITVAVLGCGLNHCYPKRHRALFQAIPQQGALVSEFWPDTQVKPHHFPMRNRIVSGLSLGLIVVEAGMKSGSLITARLAAEQGREVFAVPGSVMEPNREGCHWLIQQGAKLTTSPVDITEELVPQLSLDWDGPAHSQDCGLPHPSLLDSVGYEATAVDVVVQRSEMPIDVVLERLTELELEGWVAAVPGGYIRLRGG